MRSGAEIEAVDLLVLPGGESTTIAKAIARDRLGEPIRRHVEAGRVLFGTCAGMILCDRNHLGLIDAVAVRNAYGRQAQSFEVELDIAALGERPLSAVFIRAPRIAEHGAAVEVLARHDDDPVVVCQGSVLCATFHPELTDDLRLHEYAVALCQRPDDEMKESGSVAR